MTHDAALQLISELFRLTLLLSAPLLGVILIVGLLISVVQVVTQIQDASIAFVPKLVVFGIALLLLSPWMLSRLTSYATAMFLRLSSLH
jgi:flagellar biosynthetic protein FliQ